MRAAVLRQALSSTAGDKSAPRRLRMALILLLVAFVLFLVCASRADAGSQIWFSGEELYVTHASFYMGGEISIEGRIAYVSVPASDKDGKSDVLYNAADIYIVPNLDVSGAMETPLQDVSGMPNTIVRYGSGIFTSEIIGYAGWSGLRSGRYDLVIDEDQDQLFEPGLDTILHPDMDAAMDINTREFVASLSSVQRMNEAKQRAQDEAGFYMTTRAIWECIDTYRKLWGFKDAITELGWNETVDAIWNAYSDKLIPSPIEKLLGMLGPWEQLKAAQTNLLARYLGIAADPPDPAYQQPVCLPPQASPCPLVVDAVDSGYYELAEVTSRQAEVAQALLSAMEKYQGAEAAGDGLWALTHAREIKRYSLLLANECDSAAETAGRLRATLQSDSTDLQGALAFMQEHQSRLRTEGFGPAEYGDLLGAGLSPAAIESLRQQFISDQLQVDKAAGLEQLDSLVAGQQATAATYRALAADMDAIVGDLLYYGVEKSQPVADAGGPYAAMVGDTLSFDASSSTDPGSRALTYRWDLDGDAQFDDATGASVSRSLSAEQHGYVGVEVRNELGDLAVEYASVNVTNPIAAPRFLTLRPDQPYARVTTGQPLTFAVTTDVPADVTWWKGDMPAGAGAEWTFVPQGWETGTNELSVEVRPAGRAGPSRQYTWTVDVVSPVGPVVVPPMLDEQNVSDVTQSSATLHARMVTGTSPAFSAHLEYRRVGETEWLPTPTRTARERSTLRLDETVSELLSATSYQFRTVTTCDGVSTAGTITGFTTEFDMPTVPTVTAVESFDVGNRTAGVITTFELGDYSSADLTVQYRRQGDTVWLSAAPETQTSSGTSEAHLQGLLPGTTYEYRSVLNYSDGAAHGVGGTFTTTQMAPSMADVSAADLGLNTATIRAAIDIGDYSSVDLKVEYRRQGSEVWLGTPARTETTSGQVEILLFGLYQGTIHQYRVVLTYLDGTIVTDTLLFTTQNSYRMPSFTIVEVPSVGITSAVVRTKFSLGDLTYVHLWVEYRKLGDTNWLSSPSRYNLPAGTVDIELQGLLPDSTYEYRPVLFHPSFDRVDVADAALFTTKAMTAPSFIGVEAVNVSITTAAIRATLQLGDYASADLQVEYRQLGGSEWLATPLQHQTSATTVETQLAGLLPSSTYEWRAVLEYTDGRIVGEVATLATGPPMRITVLPVAGQSKVHGEGDPSLAFTYLPALFGDNSFTGQLGRQAGQDVGSYAITQGTLQLPVGYELAFVEGVTFAITPAQTTTSLRMECSSIRYLDSITLTAEIKPENSWSPLTGTVDFAINGTLCGSAAVQATPGSYSAEASVSVRIDGPSELPGPNGADLLVEATFTSSSGNYLGSASASSTLRVLPPVVPTPARTYTLDADFELGELDGVEHGSVHDQLQLRSTHLPHVWIPNLDGTISKIDTVTGRELARYRTAPSTISDPSPSRTTVDLEGSCYVGNRQAGTVVKVGLPELGNYIDRNRNGVADTSRDANGDGNITGDEILPWGEDEAVLYELVLVQGHEGARTPGTYTGPYDTAYYGTSPRAMAVDSEQRRVGIGLRHDEVLPRRRSERRNTDHA